MTSLPDSLVRFRTELEDAIRRELETPTPRSNGWKARVLRAVRRHPGRTALAAGAGVGVAAAALFVGSPWKSSPGFSLAQAQAALTPPPGTILHFKLSKSQMSTRFGCTVTGQDEMWIDQTSPDKWRRITSDFLDPGPLRGADPRTIACSDWGTYEHGAGTPSVPQLMFVPPNTLRASPATYLMTSDDPVAELRAMIREAIATGRAHDEGTTEIDGRVVRRFRLDKLDCPATPCPGPDYAYIDPETFLPVQLEKTSGLRVHLPGHPVLRFDIVWRFLVIEYLPRTPANVALTDIRAQHPDAEMEFRGTG
jgi:hypothetical protein